VQYFASEECSQGTELAGIPKLCAEGPRTEQAFDNAAKNRVLVHAIFIEARMTAARTAFRARYYNNGTTQNRPRCWQSASLFKMTSTRSLH